MYKYIMTHVFGDSASRNQSKINIAITYNNNQNIFKSYVIDLENEFTKGELLKATAETFYLYLLTRSLDIHLLSLFGIMPFSWISMLSSVMDDTSIKINPVISGVDYFQDNVPTHLCIDKNIPINKYLTHSHGKFMENFYKHRTGGDLSIYLQNNTTVLGHLVDSYFERINKNEFKEMCIFLKTQAWKKTSFFAYWEKEESKLWVINQDTFTIDNNVISLTKIKKLFYLLNIRFDQDKVISNIVLGWVVRKVLLEYMHYVLPNNTKTTYFPLIDRPKSSLPKGLLYNNRVIFNTIEVANFIAPKQNFTISRCFRLGLSIIQTPVKINNTAQEHSTKCAHCSSMDIMYTDTIELIEEYLTRCISGFLPSTMRFDKKYVINRLMHVMQDRITV